MRPLIAIVSCQPFFERRKAQRETWLRNINTEFPGADYRFFVGVPTGHSPIVNEPDVVNLAGCGDEYRDLSAKVFLAITWALHAGYAPMFKCDDDTYVRLTKLRTSGFAEHHFTGYMEDWDIHAGQRVVPFTVYPHPRGGAGYWLSHTAMQHALAMPNKQHQEELAVATAVMQAGLQPHHDPRYQHLEGHALQQAVAVTDNWITMHKCDPVRMQEIHLTQGGA